MATELAKAYVQIIPSAKGIKGSITNVISGEANTAGSSAGTSIASKIKGAIVAAGIGTTIAKTISSSLKEGAALQQSLGGIETLFKDSADKVIANAKNAYKTAGMSANAYMETVTSFSASLLKGLAGDTNKAADVADMALTDMSDNANKMGTSMELIQNAYQGFAKQNYTMLDNLKLGYGGTKTEMERLLSEAEKLSGVKYDISNLSDVYNAIHVIQEEMGITGTTAKEAAETFSGSFASMKAAASDFLGNLAVGENVLESFEALGSSVQIFLVNNFLPMVGNVVGNIGNVLLQNGDKMINAGAEMVTSLMSGIANNLPEIVPKAVEAVVKFADALVSNLPAILRAGIELINGLVQGIINSLPTLIAEGPRIINDFANVIYSGLGQIIMTGAQLLLSLIKGLWDNRGLLLENASEIFMMFLNIFSLSNMVSLGKNLLSSMGNGIKTMLPSIKNAGKDVLINLINGIKALATHPVQTIKGIITSIEAAFTSFSWSSIGKNIISGIASGLKKYASTIVSAAKSAAASALKAAKQALGIHSPSKVFQDEVGAMIDEGLAEGIRSNLSSVTDSMKSLSKATVGMIDTDFSVSLGKTHTIESTSVLDNAINKLLEKIDNVGSGDIVIPIYLGNSMLDELVVDSRKRVVLRSGGMANV